MPIVTCAAVGSLGARNDVPGPPLVDFESDEGTETATNPVRIVGTVGSPVPATTCETRSDESRFLASSDAAVRNVERLHHGRRTGHDALRGYFTLVYMACGTIWWATSKVMTR